MFGCTLILLASTFLAAEATYVYVGRPFTQAADPYTTNDRITGFMTFPTALINLPYQSVSPDSIYFSDGQQVYSSDPDALPWGSQFYLETDAAGNIVSWLIFFERLPYVPFGAMIQTAWDPATGNMSDVGFLTALPPPEFGANYMDPGTWTLYATPEPTTVGTLLVGTLLAMKRRQRRRGPAR